MSRLRGTWSRSFPLPTCILAAAAFSACETVVVSMVEVAEVEVVPAFITLVSGETASASAVVTENGGSELSGLAVTWTVDDPAVASVSEDGVVEARAPGTTTVRASSDGVSGAATVRVLAAPGTDPDPAPSCDVRDRLVIGTFDVPQNTRCVLTDVRVLGSLHVHEGGTLVGTRLSVSGRLDANRAAELVLDDAEVFDELRFERGGNVSIRNSHVERALTLRSNVGSIHVADTRVDRKLSLEENRGGPFTLLRNTVEELQCKANDPLPTGDGNRVEDGKGGQCEGL